AFTPSHVEDAPVEDHAEETSASLRVSQTQSQSQTQSRRQASLSQTSDELVLASLVDSQLAVLKARCPYQPHIELAVDGGGVLHLLARPVSPAGAQTPPEVVIHETIIALQTTGRWATEHMALLQ